MEFWESRPISPNRLQTKSVATGHMVSMMPSSGGLTPPRLFWVVCVAGGGDRGLSAVPWIRTRVPDLQRNPQHAAERRRGVEGIRHPNYHSDGIVGIPREERLDSGLHWCHEKIGPTVWLIVVMTFKCPMLPMEEKDLKNNRWKCSLRVTPQWDYLYLFLELFGLFFFFNKTVLIFQGSQNCFRLLW